MAIDFQTGAAEQEREAVEQVDRPIRDDGPGQERDVSFPGEDDRMIDGLRSGQLVRVAVAEEKERP